MSTLSTQPSPTCRCLFTPDRVSPYPPSPLCCPASIPTSPNTFWSSAAAGHSSMVTWWVPNEASEPTGHLSFGSTTGKVVPAPGINLKQIPTLRSREAQLHHGEFTSGAGGGLVYSPFPKGKGAARVTWTKNNV